MKIFTSLFLSMLLTLGFVHGFAATGGDCGCKDSENAIKNGSFEGTFDYWKKEGNMEWSLSTDYNVCGSKNAILYKSGKMYQDVNVVAGQKVSVTAYGGTHDKSIVHKFKLSFLDNNGNELSTGKAEVSMDYKVTSSALKQFDLSATAPSGAKKVRFTVYSEGNYFKVDVVCMSLSTPPPAYDCNCVASSKLKNPSFEQGLDDWQRTGNANFYTNSEYVICGSKNGMIQNSGSLFQDVNVAPGSAVTVSAYGGTHNTSQTHRFKLTFLDGNGNVINGDHNKEVEMDYKVTSAALKQYTLSSTAPNGAAKVRFTIYSGGDYFKFDAICMNITEPPVDCNCVASSALKNPSFEDGLNNWKLTNAVNASASSDYNVCGSKNGVIEKGFIYQEVDIEGGSSVTVSAWGGTHNPAHNHFFRLEFVDANGNIIAGNHTKEVQVDYKVSTKALQQYSMSSTAPSNATKVRFTGYSSGDWLKVDAVCLNITPPAVTPCTACDQSATVVKNASFENGTADWQKNGNFTAESKAFACGTKVGRLDGSGVVYQEISLVPGSAITLSVYAGVDNSSKSNQIGLLFYNANGQLIEGSHNKLVEVDKNASTGLQQYNVSTTAPAGAAKVYVGVTSNGGNFYFDAFCMSVTPPSQCESCGNNRAANGGFEDGLNGWMTEGNVSATAEAKNCGNNGAKIDGSGKLYQDVNFDTQWGNSATLTLWAAKTSGGTQKVTMYFYDSSNKELGKVEREVTKVAGTAPAGLVKYTLALAIPATTARIRIEATSSADGLLLDQVCLIVSGPPLPVVLSAFSATKEGTTASLTWSTTAESNSDHFDVQHSQDGKNWTVLATIAAQGESKALVNYNYTHATPFATNLYRLKMVDADETFAYSSIKSLNFNGDEQLEIYPNPTVDRIHFNSNQAVSNVKIYNISGALVLNTKPDAANEVDLTSVSQGTYFVKINDGKTARKIVIVR